MTTLPKNFPPNHYPQHTWQGFWHDEADTCHLAQILAAINPIGSIWLQGELGAGKTTFVRYLLRYFGYQGVVKSPTYTLVEPYVLPNKTIYHADLYRLVDPEELEFMGFFDYYNCANLLLIEWASRADTLLPAPDISLDIARIDDDAQGKNDSRIVHIAFKDPAQFAQFLPLIEAPKKQ